jgi:hypothetical protein
MIIFLQPLVAYTIMSVLLMALLSSIEDIHQHSAGNASSEQPIGVTPE